ncbi:MAG: type VI secretion system protein ImpH [Oleiphilaceae bacterium]
MATQNRRKVSYLAQKIDSSPWRFDFFQLVKLLENEMNASNEVGDFTPANLEAIKFKTNPQLNFEPAPIQSIQRVKNRSKQNKHSESAPKETAQSELEVNFWGLNGSSGTLPFHYSELITQRIRNNDYALRDFIDIFNHRSLSLFYKAWQKHRPWLQHPSKDKTVSKYKINHHQAILKGLAGLSGEKNASFNKPEGAWLNYSGFASARICSASTLKQAINHHFGLSVRINEFKGQWESMPADVRTRLADRKSNGMNNILGVSALLGARCWNVQNRFEVEIVQIEYEQFMTLSPGSEKLNALYELIKFKVGTELDFDLILKVHKNKLHPASLEVGKLPQLGWNSRLQSRPKHKNESNDIIKVSISKHGMHRLANAQKQVG